MQNSIFTKRRNVWVNKKIQGSLLLKCTMYWFSCLCVIMLFVGIGTAFSGKLQSAGQMLDQIWTQFSPAIIASVCLLPIVAFDVIRSSHRIAGPIKRLENEMRKLANGEQVNPVHFRPNDHCHELAREFNRVVELQQQLRESEDSRSPAEESEPEDSSVEMETVG